MNPSEAATATETTRGAAREPRFRVCLAAYNGASWLDEQIDSIRSQQGVEVDLVVSVDVSTDGSEALVDARAREHGGIVVLPHGQRFGGAARNFYRLVRDADFSGIDYVAFADQDDVWLPEKLARAHKSMSAAPASAYSSNVIAFWPGGRTRLVDKAQRLCRWDFLFESAGPGCTYVLSRELALAFQTWLIDHWEGAQGIVFHDWLIYAFARARGVAWHIDGQPGVMYRQHGANQLGANKGWQALRYRLRKVFDGWGLDQALAIARLVGVDSEPFVRRWSGRTFAGYVRLAFAANDCRRKRSHRVVFFVLCLVLACRSIS